jgi:hypothetical protein
MVETRDFNPETVARFRLETDSVLVREDNGELVYSEDYDRLLGLYNAALLHEKEREYGTE